MQVTTSFKGESCFDAVLVGAGIMSSTLAVLLHELEPEMKILIVERLLEPGLESSFALNNAGTGHAANCELNYTPIATDGSIAIEKALGINRAFEQSLELWASLATMGKLAPNKFLKFLPHISFVSGSFDVDFLRNRFQKLNAHNAFEDMEWSTDREELEDWLPLVLQGRSNKIPMAATRIKRGTDIDFGTLTSEYLQSLKKTGSLEIKFSTEVVDLQKIKNQFWRLDLKDISKSYSIQAPFVFIGAGGGTLSLLQKSGIPEASFYAGFPVSGQWLVCDHPALTNMHTAKVYGKTKLGAPPMSVPHLDTRWIAGKRSLLFGPFAGATTKFLKNGSIWDLFLSLKTSNFLPFMQAGLNNIDLINYLAQQVRLNHHDRVKMLKDFIPNAKESDWNLSKAGQRVQIIKRTTKGGILKMGTEVVSSDDGSLAALLGASPGASTAVTIMLDVLQRCWPLKMATKDWEEKLNQLFPSFGKDINKDSALLQKVRTRNNEILGFNES